MPAADPLSMSGYGLIWPVRPGQIGSVNADNRV
jgi:hypothetical protein